MMGCNKCMKVCGALCLVFGVLFLLRDLAIWNFWNINWWTVVFLLAAVGKLSMIKCPECQAMMKKK
ncbi:hypothetical protein HY498_04080 [Candidatus Woesearchaeota archaeon]|nr:hypothetical protein [Candidatus Woesearchaeota archaeon]